MLIYLRVYVQCSCLFLHFFPLHPPHSMPSSTPCAPLYPPCHPYPLCPMCWCTAMLLRPLACMLLVGALDQWLGQGTVLGLFLFLCASVYTICVLVCFYLHACFFGVCFCLVCICCDIYYLLGKPCLCSLCGLKAETDNHRLIGLKDKTEIYI